jgi:hypothetical protein
MHAKLFVELRVKVGSRVRLFIDSVERQPRGNVNIVVPRCKRQACEASQSLVATVGDHGWPIKTIRHLCAIKPRFYLSRQTRG